MSRLNIAVVSRDPAVRAAIAERFDSAPRDWLVGLFEEPPDAADVIVRGPDVSIDSDVVFDPERPEELVDEIVALRPRVAKLFVVTGAGRGTGVTSAALHLARGLAPLHATCLLDLDTTWAGIRDRLGLGGGPAKTWAEAGTSEDDLRLAALPMPGGFRVLCAAPGCAVPPDLVGRATDHFDRVVVDLPAGEPDEVLRSASAALLLVPPTASGIARARVQLARPTARWGVVVSRTGHGGEARRAEIEEAIGRKALCELPCTPALRDAEDGGRLLRGPWTRYNRRIARLAAGLDAL